MNEKIQNYVGKTATITFGALSIRVKIKDVKNSYGRDRFLITPIAGSGETWVEQIKLEQGE